LLPNTGTGPGLITKLLKEHDIHPAFARKIVSNYKIGTSFPGLFDTPEERLRKSVNFLSLLGEESSCNN
jgi:hypothetical protein